MTFFNCVCSPLLRAWTLRIFFDIFVTCPLERDTLDDILSSSSSLFKRFLFCTSLFPDVIARTTHGSLRIASRPAGRRANACTTSIKINIVMKLKIILYCSLQGLELSLNAHTQPHSSPRQQQSLVFLHYAHWIRQHLGCVEYVHTLVTYVHVVV